MLDRLQRGLEQLYRIDTRVSVDDFVIDDDARSDLGVARSPREQLLLAENDGELEIGLFVDPDTLANLRRHDPTERLGDHNLQDFLHAIEGVSHFVYVVWNAAGDRPVSALELELQAEIDKYVTCLLTAEGGATVAHSLHRRLFQQFSYEPDLDADERHRYEVANANAARYSDSLRRRYVETRKLADMLGELRRFYRMTLRGKLDHIQRAA